MAVLRRVAMTWGAVPVPVRVWERSSSKVTSREPVESVFDVPAVLDPAGEMSRQC